MKLWPTVHTHLVNHGRFGGRFWLVRCNCSSLRFPDPLGGWFVLVWYSCDTLTFPDPLGDWFRLVRYNSYCYIFVILVQSVCDPGVRFQYPGLRSWQSGDRFRYTGVRFLVPDSHILVSDRGVRFGRRPSLSRWNLEDPMESYGELVGE